MKQFTKFLLAVALLAGTGYTAVNAQTAVKADSTEMVDPHLSGFSSIKIGGPFEVHITQGAVESVKYAETPDVKGHITAEVSGGVLKIHNTHDKWWGKTSWYGEKSIWRNHKKIKVYITAKNLEAITVSGSGDLFFEEGITAEALNLKLRGSGSIVGKVDVKTLVSHISGSGGMKLSGNAGSSRVKVAGSGRFNGRSLVTTGSAVVISGSGRAEINASDKVDATVHGSGGVSYTGTAKAVSSSKSGSGEISRF